MNTPPNETTGPIGSGGAKNDQAHPAYVAIVLAATQGTPVVWVAGRPHRFPGANVQARADATDVGPLIDAALQVANDRRTQLTTGNLADGPMPPAELVLDVDAVAHAITTPGLADQLITLIRTGPEVDVRPRLGSALRADHSVAGEHLVRVITVLLDLRDGAGLPADLPPDLADLAHQVVATTPVGWDRDVRERALRQLREAVR